MVSNFFYRLTLSEGCSMKLFLYRVALQPLPRNCKFCNNILWLGFVFLPARKQFPFFQTLFKLLTPMPPRHTFSPPPPVNLLHQLAACLHSGYLGRICQKEPTPISCYILPSPLSSWQERCWRQAWSWEFTSWSSGSRAARESPFPVAHLLQLRHIPSVSQSVPLTGEQASKYITIWGLKFFLKS